MTLNSQIKDARKALDELTADEADLTRLEAEQVAEVAALKAAGSKDFAQLATLEGKRAALASMLTEQRTSIEQARAELVRLEAEADRSRALDRIGAIAVKSARIHDAVRAGLDEMAARMLSDLQGLFALEDEWGELREAFQQEARSLGHPVINMGPDGVLRAAQLYDELAAHGVDVQALKAHRLSVVPIYQGQPAPLITVVKEPNATTPFKYHVPTMLVHLYVNAWNTRSYLKGRKVEDEA